MLQASYKRSVLHIVDVRLKMACPGMNLNHTPYRWSEEGPFESVYPYWKRSYLLNYAHVVYLHLHKCMLSCSPYITSVKQGLYNFSYPHIADESWDWKSLGLRLAKVGYWTCHSKAEIRARSFLIHNVASQLLCCTWGASLTAAGSGIDESSLSKVPD